LGEGEKSEEGRRKEGGERVEGEVESF